MCVPLTAGGRGLALKQWSLIFDSSSPLFSFVPALFQYFDVNKGVILKLDSGGIAAKDVGGKQPSQEQGKKERQ